MLTLEDIQNHLELIETNYGKIEEPFVFVLNPQDAWYIRRSIYPPLDRVSGSTQEMLKRFRILGHPIRLDYHMIPGQVLVQKEQPLVDEEIESLEPIEVWLKQWGDG